MSTESWIALVLLLNMSVYMNIGGTDFGGRYLALTVSGPRKRHQLAAIGEAIGPLYAVHHILFLLAASLLFVAFPVAVTVAAEALLVPVALLFGATGVRCLVLFLELRRMGEQARYGVLRVLFGSASVIAVLSLGMVLGAMSSGEIRLDPYAPRVWASPVSAWLAPFPLSFGGFLLGLSALSACVRVVNATEESELREIFRRRALRIAVTVGALAFLTFLLTEQGAPHLADGLSNRFWSIPFQILTGGVSVGAIFAIWRGNDALASVLVMAQVTLVVLGWGLAQQPHLIYPDLEVGEAVGREATLRFVLAALAIGTALLFLSFFYPKRLQEKAP